MGKIYGAFGGMRQITIVALAGYGYRPRITKVVLRGGKHVRLGQSSSPRLIHLNITTDATIDIQDAENGLGRAFLYSDDDVTELRAELSMKRKERNTQVRYLRLGQGS